MSLPTTSPAGAARVGSETSSRKTKNLRRKNLGALLLDTHVLVWARLSPEHLSEAASEALEDEDNELWYSPISVWEMLLLAEKKRLKIKGDPYRWVELALEGLQEAPLNQHVALESRRIKLAHNDPGDRFIAATALVYDPVLVTADRELLQCPALKTL